MVSFFAAGSEELGGHEWGLGLSCFLFCAAIRDTLGIFLLSSLVLVLSEFGVYSSVLSPSMLSIPDMGYIT